MALLQKRPKFEAATLNARCDRLMPPYSTGWQKVRFLLSVGLLVVILPLAFRCDRAMANTAAALSETEISQKLQQLPGWTQQGNQIVNTFEFQDFVTAVDFVNKLVEPAESAGHHPDLAIAYNKVTVSLTSHDAGGITERDFALAKVISQLAE